ncbi:MAG TPA: ubiquinol-cytochrome c reductase iron-sulfur subunit [Pyrinomonadaceae bacterium]|nr:ubiquinol-cytochrome c reductase iron-sulfur subunit [Pyrinomonadaceae bacterium]
MKDSPKPTRRSFLLLVPLGIFASIAGAAFKFLRPRISAATDSWLDVAPINEITGSQPITKKVVAEHIAGWAITTEEHNVFVLPARSNQVVSAVCPHEGCEVLWEQQRNQFSCPCHESYFAADGARLSGPSPRGLDPLPTRVQDGKLQVQYGLPQDQANRA